MITALWLRLKGWAAMAGAVLLVLAGAYALGGRAARKSAQLEQARRDERAAKAATAAQESARRDRDATDQTISRLPPGESAKRLRDEWNRDR